MRLFFVLLLAPLFCVAPLPARAQHEDITNRVGSGVLLVTDSEGEELIAHHADQIFVPASVTKIVTGWLAVHTLGRDHRFTTRFYLDEERNLYVRGGGDPYLISEELALLAPALLEATGSAPFADLVLDASYYEADLRIPGVGNGDQPYNALNSALAVNFNTINARLSGSTVTSAEEQTPLTPLARSDVLARGRQGTDRVSLTQRPEVSLRYAGELLSAFIERAGGAVEGEIRMDAVPDALEPVYLHRQSRPLSEIVTGMLRYSNNYIANQIFLEVGAQVRGGPASLEKTVAVLDEQLARHGLEGRIVVEEGSGISRNNRFDPRALIELLGLFEDDRDLLYGRNGAPHKTGTLTGVRTLSGYVDHPQRGRLRFVLALNSNDGEERFRLLQRLEGI